MQATKNGERANNSTAIPMGSSQNELVSLKEQKLITTSRIVAEFFQKRHDNVMRAIKVVPNIDNFNALNFEVVEYRDTKGQQRPEYLMTKDGFAFLAMGFTGYEAAKFKIAFINAFNEMESKLFDRVMKPTRRELAMEDIRMMMGDWACSKQFEERDPESRNRMIESWKIITDGFTLA